MRIKGSDGHDYNVTGQGQGTYNTVGASAGIASFLGLNAGNLLGGLGNGWNGNRNGYGCGCGCNSADMGVTRYDAALMNEIAAKDGRIALLESNIYTDQKLSDVYERLNTKIESIRAAQEAVNTQQAVFNGGVTSTLGCIQGQIAQLYSLTKLVVPNTSVCPGWGNVTITPAAATTTPAGA